MAVSERVHIKGWEHRQRQAMPRRTRFLTPAAEQAIVRHGVTVADVKAALTAPVGPRLVVDTLFDQRGRPKVNMDALREDCISIYRNSRLSLEEVRARGGPTPNTVSRLLSRESSPQLATCIALLRVCGHDLYVGAGVRAR